MFLVVHKGGVNSLNEVKPERARPYLISIMSRVMYPRYSGMVFLGPFNAVSIVCRQYEMSSIVISRDVTFNLSSKSCFLRSIMTSIKSEMPYAITKLCETILMFIRSESLVIPNQSSSPHMFLKDSHNKSVSFITSNSPKSKVWFALFNWVNISSVNLIVWLSLKSQPRSLYSFRSLNNSGFKARLTELVSFLKSASRIYVILLRFCFKPFSSASKYSR